MIRACRCCGAIFKPKQRFHKFCTSKCRWKWYRPLSKNKQYPRSTRAWAIERITSGDPPTCIARDIGCTMNTVSRWYEIYAGYKGNDGVTITRQSKINMIE